MMQMYSPTSLSILRDALQKHFILLSVSWALHSELQQGTNILLSVCISSGRALLIFRKVWASTSKAQKKENEQLKRFGLHCRLTTPELENRFSSAQWPYLVIVKGVAARPSGGFICIHKMMMMKWWWWRQGESLKREISDSVRMAIHFFVNFDVFKWL